MSKVYLAISVAPDRLLGRIDDNGKIYRSQVGPDDEMGHVDLSTGEIYEQHFGPDKKVGHVALSSGKVYATRLGPDAYVGEVSADGRMHRHQTLATDEYIGKVDQFLSYAHSAGAMLLLVLPVLEPDTSSETPDEEGETDQ